MIPENREKAGTADRLHHARDGSELLSRMATMSPDVQILVWTGRASPVSAAGVPTLESQEAIPATKENRHGPHHRHRAHHSRVHPAAPLPLGAADTTLSPAREPVAVMRRLRPRCRPAPAP